MDATRNIRQAQTAREEETLLYQHAALELPLVSVIIPAYNCQGRPGQRRPLAAARGIVRVPRSFSRG